MPAFNAGSYIADAILSVLAQTWQEWELIVVNDGSTDDTATVVEGFMDRRIRCWHQSNLGVSTARNKGIDLSQGAFVAFLDADDRLPERSLESRADLLLAHPNVAFVDGAVDAMDHISMERTPIHRPSYQGPPFHLLMRMSPAIFCGPTWMVRKDVIGADRLPVGMSHAEDLAFYLTIARRGDYMATPELILLYRKGHGSAMSNLDGLDRGYLLLHGHASSLVPPPTSKELQLMWCRIRRVMTLGFLKAYRFWPAAKVLLRTPPSHR